MALASQLRLEERDLVMLVSQIDVPDLPEQLLADDRPVRREASTSTTTRLCISCRGASLFAEHDLVLVALTTANRRSQAAPRPARICALSVGSGSAAAEIAPLGSGWSGFELCPSAPLQHWLGHERCCANSEVTGSMILGVVAIGEQVAVHGFGRAAGAC